MGKGDKVRMTNKEAIDMIKHAIAEVEWMYPMDYAVAFDKAIEALELLKKQEPILLENQHKPYGHVINVNSPWISKCPKCGKKIEGKQTRYCKYCGQAVKWND